MAASTNIALTSEDQSRMNFYEKVDQHTQSMNYKYREKTVISTDMKNKILRCFSEKHPEEFNAKFRSWCRTSFTTRRIGQRTVLCDSKAHKPVIIYEEMYGIFKRIHEETAHGGRDKCLDNLSINYSWFNRQLLQIFLNNCEPCQKRQSVKTPVSDIPLESIEADEEDIQEAPFKLTSMKITTDDESPHESIRRTARDNYLKSQQKRQKQYDDHVQRIADSYKDGDLVGISISKVDRTNCDPKIMPCLIEKRSDNADIPMYHLISPYGRLSTCFPVHQLIPMSGLSSAVSQRMKFDHLQTISFVEASKLFARGSPSATCDCKTKCRTKVCPCRRASVPCSTKCHAKLGQCTNVEEQLV